MLRDTIRAEAPSADGALTRSAPACFWCGAPERAALHEVWNHREFMLDTCCEGLHEQLSHDMAADPAAGARLLRALDVEAFCGDRLRRVADDGAGGLILDWQLRFGPVPFARAARFVQRHHAHCEAPTGWKFGQGLFNGLDLIAVVMVAHPLARAYMHRGWLEVTRLCARRDRPAALRWNACSMLYGWAAREARKRGSPKLITYTRQDEDGVTLLAAGWTSEGAAGGRSWDTRSRPRQSRRPPCQRMRWSKWLRGRREKV